MANPALRPRFLAPGDRLGKFDLLRQIAVGDMAELYLARTVGIEGFEKLVVVKRILPQYAEDQSFVDTFLHEARLSATLRHPNITQVDDIGVEDGDYFFSMEYVHGEDLGRTIVTAVENGVPISLDSALTLIVGLCAGLHYAHDKAGVHRDVSPSNVIVSYEGGVKLVDFGIARTKGKIAYTSPEQCRGETALDRRSDVFSIGTMLYELTTGHLPFTAETEHGVLDKIITTDAARPSAIVPSYPPALEAIVMKALARDIDQRYATALELQGQLEGFAHENRLRVSPLVLARLMSALFPARLEEWDHARAQGAFFVEQHVVRTLIESGKTLAVAPDEEPTAVTALAPMHPSTSVDSAPVIAPPRIAIAEGVRVPPPLPMWTEQGSGAPPKRSRLPLVLGAVATLAIGAAVAVMALGGSSKDTLTPAAVASPQPEPTQPRIAEPVAADPVAVEPVAAPKAVTVPAVTAPPRIVDKRLKPTATLKPKKSAEVVTPSKAEPRPKKDPAWNDDSPFMPVRTDKR